MFCSNRSIIRQCRMQKRLIFDKKASLVKCQRNFAKRFDSGNFTAKLRNNTINCKLWVWCGAKACKPCRSQKVFQNIFAKFDFDLAENGPSKVWTTNPRPATTREPPPWGQMNIDVDVAVHDALLVGIVRFLLVPDQDTLVLRRTGTRHREELELGLWKLRSNTD